MEENSNFNDRRAQISRQNSVKSLDELLQPLASSTMIDNDLTMIGKSVDNDLVSTSPKKVSFNEQLEIVLYDEDEIVTSFQQNLQAPIVTDDQDLVQVNNLVEQEICQPTSTLNEVLNSIDSNNEKPNSKNVSVVVSSSQLHRYPSEDVDKENQAAGSSVIRSSNVENVGNSPIQDNNLDFSITDDFSEDINEAGKKIILYMLTCGIFFNKIFSSSASTSCRKYMSDMNIIFYETFFSPIA